LKVDLLNTDKPRILLDRISKRELKVKKCNMGGWGKMPRSRISKRELKVAYLDNC